MILVKRVLPSLFLVLAGLFFLLDPAYSAIQKEIRIETVPPGAAVYLKTGNREKRIGTTPFKWAAKFHSDISIQKIIVRKNGYEIKTHKVRASEKQVSLQLTVIKFIPESSKLKSPRLRAIQEKINPVLQKYLLGWFGQIKDIEFQLIQPVQVIEQDGKTLLSFDLYLDRISMASKKGSRQGNKLLLKKLWTQFGNHVLQPLAKELPSSTPLSGIQLNLMFSKTGSRFGVKSRITTKVKVECRGGYYTIGRQTYFNPCQTRVPVTYSKVVVDPQTKRVKKTYMVRFHAPLSLLTPATFDPGTFHKIAIILMGPNKKVIFNQNFKEK